MPFMTDYDVSSFRTASSATFWLSDERAFVHSYAFIFSTPFSNRNSSVRTFSLNTQVIRAGHMGTRACTTADKYYTR